MSATKILWGQILVVFLIVLATTWGATHMSPGGSAFSRSSAALVRAGGWPIYYPPAFFWWWYFYDAYAPRSSSRARHRGVRRLHRHRRRHRHVGLARARSQERRDLRLGALGRRKR
jgi:hypothetical protein